MKWNHYPELEAIKHLRDEGRELLGKEIIFTEKRDGESVSLWIDDSNSLHISSHYMEEADESIVSRMKETLEFEKVKDLLYSELQYNLHFIAYGELMKAGRTPTRLERPRKKVQWILFDLLDTNEDRFANYTLVYQRAYQYKIPVVKAIDTFAPKSLEELTERIKVVKTWCKKHKREGVVGKVYAEKQIFFKEKIDTPNLPKVKLPEKSEIKLPEMPEERIIRALQHAYDELGTDWTNKAKAMPIVAKQLSLEAREHNFAIPKHIFQLYTNNPNPFVKQSSPSPSSLQVKSAEA